MVWTLAMYALALSAMVSPAPDFTSKLPFAVSVLPLDMLMLLSAVLLLVLALVVRWPASVTLPAPIKLVPLRARVPV